MKGNFRLRQLAPLGITAVALLTLAACAESYPNTTFTPHSELGRAIDSLWDRLLLLGTIVFVLVEGALIYVVFRYRHRPSDTDAPPQGSPVARPGAEEWAVDPSPNPEARLVNSQTQERLLAVLRALPEPARMCLSLRAEGLRYREIAQVLGMSLGAVSLSVARSLARLARASER